ncbi:MAG TPA: hypothetical protein VJV78_20665 [Polyangiales bacterium]|nr:hypothetical protein [Polyangiales bacterium]
MGKHDALEHLSVGPGWGAFTQADAYWHAAIVLISATLSGVLLAYHPVYRGRPLTLDILEQRKTIIIYSAVGALIAIICTVAPSMAFVIFGIGGLMRFRTNTGESTVTGQTIMGTLIGLCWGLGLQLVAALATVYFGIMIYVLEAAPIKKVTIGIELASMQRAAELYREALVRAGCRVLAHSKSFKKEQMHFVLRVPSSFGADEALRAFAEIPEGFRGTVDWPE